MLNIEREDVQKFLMHHGLDDIGVDNNDNVIDCEDFSCSCEDCIFDEGSTCSRSKLIKWLASEVKGE